MNPHTFTPEEIRKTAMDVLDIARQIEQDFEGDDNAQDLGGRMRKISILLIGYFPYPKSRFSLPETHTLGASSVGSLDGTSESPL